MGYRPWNLSWTHTRTHTHTHTDTHTYTHTHTHTHTEERNKEVFQITQPIRGSLRLKPVQIINVAQLQNEGFPFEYLLNG